jgi:hypothetical protein
MEGSNYELAVWEGSVIDIKVPTKLVFTVAEAEH